MSDQDVVAIVFWSFLLFAFLFDVVYDWNKRRKERKNGLA